MDAYLTVDQTANLLAVTAPTVRSLLHRGLLRGIRVGRQWRISRATIERLDASTQGTLDASTRTRGH